MTTQNIPHLRSRLLLRLVCCCVTATCLFSSCDDYLDELPDNRAELNTDSKITELLVNAYPRTSYFLIAESYSDNTDHCIGSPSYTAFAQSGTTLHEEAATWKDITDKNQDSPTALWENCYKSIAAANNVLNAIAEQGNPKRLNAQRGEALLCRAYCHFVLGNIFCMPYSTKTCDTAMGITYMKTTESTVSPTYSRGTMAELYRDIAADIEEGLPLIDDNIYSVPKYHFNRRAAYAFASRFYLYYMKDDKSNLDKCIEYATRVLTSKPEEMMRDWKTLGNKATGSPQYNAFIDASDKANLLIISASSYWEWVYGPTAVAKGYCHDTKISTTETLQSTGFWGSQNTYFKAGQMSGSPKIYMLKMGQYFEYTDVVKGIGSPRMIVPAFTTEALILDRAEAYALKGDYTNAYADLKVWMNSFTSNQGDVTSAMLNTAYGTMKDFYTPLAPTPKKHLDPDFTITAGEQENLIHAVLHARRVTTLHEGLRWFDVKRYGIEIYRRDVDGTLGDGNITVLDTMKKDDPRRAIQLPQYVITAGITANPR
ncbi:RagB/SusD family nutrient uptake outer membrane protein [Prevotella sp. E13-27]|uniref:RagB/SusD family nutrient uptake outer membrane protein n=1 Tax=Prevotella sp. E13-27 TaxID=2938122 RepID=UPI00200AAD80|nr:RagB/SusD family nutrient uptake outer membrane protein [Prevotella sp. E13-27]MCK8621986.1 RagB/SusD family nutrient uptake outer membrane protein [Prevotella sp. E13-27]